VTGALACDSASSSAKTASVTLTGAGRTLIGFGGKDKLGFNTGHLA
jgi:hypothetical protein